MCVCACGKYRDFAHTAGFHHPCGAKTEVSRDVKCYSVVGKEVKGKMGGCDDPTEEVACVRSLVLSGLRGRCAACGPQINASTTLSPGLNAPSVCLHGEGETEWKDLRGVL